MRNEANYGTVGLANEPPNERELIKRLYNDIQRRLPDSWQLELIPETRRPTGKVDAILRVTDGKGTQGNILIEVKRHIDPIDVPQVVAQLRRYASPNEGMVAVTPFAGPRARLLLAENGVGYADASGNLRLQLDQPAVYIETIGVDKNPWRQSRQLHSLRGPAAGRIVRALCDFRPPHQIRTLAQLADTPASSVSRVVSLLERDALITRGPSGEVIHVRWAELLRRWTRDYVFSTSNKTQAFLEPRGLDTLLRKLATTAMPYAVTGSLAAVRIAPIAPPRLATIYVPDAETAAEELALRRVERGPNVLLAEPFNPVVFDRGAQENGVTYAALSQVLPDLLTGPGRSPQEGEELLRWMRENENAWRR